jgi:hypothetical protein
VQNRRKAFILQGISCHLTIRPGTKKHSCRPTLTLFVRVRILLPLPARIPLKCLIFQGNFILRFSRSPPSNPLNYTDFHANWCTNWCTKAISIIFN